jgi:hypothetical protein
LIFLIYRFEDALKIAQTALLILGIANFVLFVIYLGLGASLFKKGGHGSRKREVEGETGI